MTLQPDELEALKSYAKEHGRTWKSNLWLDWYHARASVILMDLRNSPNFGPTGLDNFRMPK